MPSWLEAVIQFLPLTMGCLGLWALLAQTRLRRALAGVRQNRVYSRGKDVETRTREFPILPTVATVWFIFFVAGILMTATGHVFRGGELTDEQSWTRSATLVFTGVGAVVAILIHLRPNHSRALKYCLIITPLAFQDLLVLGMMVARWQPSSAIVIFNQWSLILTIFLLASYPVWAEKVRHGLDYRMSHRLRMVFAFLRARFGGLITLILILYAPDIALILLTGRFVIVELFRERPIVYLRSFHFAQSKSVFGKAVAPALAPLGVVTALVHSKQTGQVLLARASIWQFGLLATIPDEHWQSWVRGSLERADLVVIDRSVLTESVAWEVETAFAAAGPGRVLLLDANETSTNSKDQQNTIYYNILQLRQLKSVIRSWAMDMVGLTRWRVHVVTTMGWLLIFGLVVGKWALFFALFNKYVGEI